MLKGEGHCCHICGHGRLTDFPEFSPLGRAASDCRPWPAGGKLAVCNSCGTVQKPVDDEWRQEIEAIYADYSLYHQSPEGVEQPVFNQSTGVPSPRSSKILTSVNALKKFAYNGRMLDVGCGTGVMLRAFSELRREWELYGADPNIKTAELMKEIPGVRNVFHQPPKEIDGSFDLITVIHALEHIENPIDFLKGLAEKLHPDGQILIEVPYFPDNPFDLLIADHCTHFTVSTFLYVIAQAGFSPISVRTDIVEKEITALITLSDAPVSAQFAQVDAHVSAVTDCLTWLRSVLALATNLSKDGTFGIFGTSISANWLFGELEEHVAYFVDEDPTRVGSTYRDRPVVDPSGVPDGGDVFMVLPRQLSEKIIERLSSCQAKFMMPPDFTQPLIEAFISE